MLGLVKLISVYYVQNLFIDSHIQMQSRLRVVFVLSLVKFISVYYAQTLFVDSHVYMQYRLRVVFMLSLVKTYQCLLCSDFIC